MCSVCSDPSDPNGINKQFAPVNNIEDLNQNQYPFLKKTTMHNYSGKNKTNIPNPFKRKSIAVNDGSFYKAKDIKSPSDKKLCEAAVSDDSVQPVK